MLSLRCWIKEGEEGAEQAEESSMGKAGQHSSRLRGTGLFRSKTERMLLRSILKGNGVGERRPQGHSKGLTNLGLVGAQH